MLNLSRAYSCLFAILLFGCPGTMNAQRPANSNASYQQLRELLPGSDVITVSNLELHRDAATFTFRQGSIAFYGPVNGKITGAVFIGDGHFHLTPPTVEERHNLAIVTHRDEVDEDFSEAVLRFTDATAAQLHKDSAGTGHADKAFDEAARDSHNFLRTKLKDNLDLRLLEGVLSPAQDGFFLAAMHGKKDPHMIFRLDPYGADDVEPEEVSLMNWNAWGPSYPTAFHDAYDLARAGSDSGERNSPYRVDNEDLDISIDRNGFLSGIATVHILAVQDGVVVVPLNLYPTLRVSRVDTDKGAALDYVQEKKDEDSDFGVVLAQPLKAGESATVRITYGGKDVVKDEGNSNYYPVARENWYPNGSSGFGDYAMYHMLFHVPKGLQLIATGTKVSDKTDGKITTTEWKTDVPLAVVGFNLGEFKMKEVKIQDKSGGDVIIDAYANTQPPDMFTRHEGAPMINESNTNSPDALGSLDTTAMLPQELSEAEVAARIYTNYFGPLPFARVSVTQQSACLYGQSWPMLVYLPICGFLDQTQQHFMGLSPENMYWKVVTPHEMSHQWWGQTVGFSSYRDQWMSEGFAQTSASIFLQATRPKPDEFLQFWKQQQKLLIEKNAFGFRPIDVGPVTMGFRLSSSKTGWDVYQNLVYPKGAYILHMIRMMMWTPKEGDERFKATMHDLVNTYRLKPATTEDFKAIVEKHMSPSMDLDGNGKMDWFFNQYVYGTDLPTYHFEGQVAENATGATLHYKLTQSGVSPDFKMLVPIYLEFNKGKIIRLGAVRIAGSTTQDQTVNLPRLPEHVQRVFINYFYDVLSTEN